MADDVQRDLGDHNARLNALEKRNDEMSEKIDEMYALMMQGKGGWKTLAALGGVVSLVSGAVAGTIGWFAHGGTH